MVDSSSFQGLFRARFEELDAFRRRPVFDVLIVGGGIHGAAMAHLASANGLKVALFERGDYASETSSRSTKLAHGGLRYLELLDVKQVFEGIKAREELFLRAPGIVKPGRFLIPISRADWWQRLKLKTGLTLYDSFVRENSRRHRWIPRQQLDHRVFHSGRNDLMGCFEYCDGLMNDTSLVIEHIVAARKNGANCLNHAEVVAVDQSPSAVSITCRERFTGERFDATGAVMVNCAGPWARSLFQPPDDFPQLRFSRGSHVILDKQWEGEALFLPLAAKGRYYFVLPHPGGTLIGTTEREVPEPTTEPVPSPDEIAEISDRISCDLAPYGYSIDQAFTSFAGIRTLPVRSGIKDVSRIHRRHIWNVHRRIVSLAGGKYTTYASTVAEGLALAKSTIVNLGRLKVELPLSVRECSPRDFQSIEDGDLRLRSAVEESIDVEQAVTVSDILFRRMQMGYLPHHGIRTIPLVCQSLSARGIPQDEILRQVESYIEQVNSGRNSVGRDEITLDVAAITSCRAP